MEFEWTANTSFKNETFTDIQTYKTWHGSYFSQGALPNSIIITFVFAGIAIIGALLTYNNISKLFSGTDFASEKKRKGIPSVSTFTILKSFLQCGTDFQTIVETIVAKYGGIFKLNLLGLYNIVFLSDPAMVQKLCMSNEQGHLHKPKWYSKVLLGALQNGLVCSRADVWKVHRSAVSKAFTYQGLLRQINIFEEHVKRFVFTMQESLSSSNDISNTSFEKQVYKVTFEIISHIAAGKEMHDVREEDKTRFQNNIERAKELISYRIYHPLNYMDYVWTLNPKKWEIDKILDDMQIYCYKEISTIRKQFEADDEMGLNTEDDMAGKSLAEVMINVGLSNEDIFAEITTLILAGHETVSATLNLLLFLLSRHQEYQDKCREEIDQMFDRMRTSNSNDVSMEALKSLPFVDMCIKQCLRLYPLIPIFGRELESPLQMDEDTYLPPNTMVFTSPLIVHCNPNIYPEPEKFNSERFSSEQVKNIGPCVYFPFSIGPRNCIGFQSASIELKVLVAYILHNFEVHSEMSIDDLNQAVRKLVWPFPDMGIQIQPRQ